MTHPGGASERGSADCVVVGAGIAGLSAAGELAAAGARTIVLEKSRGVGGRMATRRVGGAVCDHGAQFFTVRTRAFAATVSPAEASGDVAVWCRGFPRGGSHDAEPVAADDGHARFRGTRGMTDLPKRLAAALPGARVALRTGVRAAAVTVGEGGIDVRLEPGADGVAGVIRARSCVLTCPVPQALDLIAAGGPGGRLDAAALGTLGGVGYDPCFALLLALDRGSRVPQPGGMQFEAGPISWVADNQRKGISPLPALTIHASGAWSRERFDDDPAEVTRDLEALAARWIGEARVLERSLKRWRFATPTTILPVPLVAVSAAPPLVVCGDAFQGPRVEGAACSGQAAGRWAGRLLAEG